MRNLLVFLFILIVVPCCAQNIDSLKKIAFSNQPAKKRIKAAHTLSNYFSEVNTNETLAVANTGLGLAIKLDDKKGIGEFLRDIGTAYYLKGSYDSTINYLTRSIIIFEKIKDEKGMVDDCQELGKLYTQTKNYEKAIEIYVKIITLSQKPGLRPLLMTSLNQLGSAYENNHNYPEALKCFKQASDIKASLDILKKTKDSTSLSYSLDFIGDVLGSMKYKGETEEYLLKSLEMRKSLHDTLAMAVNYFNLGILYKEKKEYPKSLDALQQCLQYATAIKYPSLQNSALNELADLYERTGNYQKSLQYFKKYKDLNDVAFSGKNSKSIAELQTKYETTIREKEILQQRLEISKRNYWVAGIASVFVLSLLVSYFYYKQTQLRQHNIATQAIIETEEKERKRIAQDLHDSVSQTMTAAKMNLTVVGNELQFINDEQRLRFEKAIHLVDTGFREVRTISHNMMPVALLESGLALVIKQFIEDIENPAMSINFFSKGFEEHFSDTIETILYRILQECINNVMKHAQASRLDISLIKDDQAISLAIEDNGKGFDMTGPNRHAGMGLKNMQVRVSFVKGKIELDSHPGRGTLVSVLIPLTNKPL